LFADPDVEALSAFGKAVRSYYDVSLSLPTTFKVIELRKDIESGQQLESFGVDALIMVRGPRLPAYRWEQPDQQRAGTTIDYRCVSPLGEPIAATDVRLRMLSARAKAAVILLCATTRH
jgi:alpha-L-fucosidase